MIELYEDNAGGLWIAVDDEGIAIEMPRNGDFLTDARLYRAHDGWTPDEFPESVHPLEEVRALLDDVQTSHVASYDPATDTEKVHLEPHEMGHAAREYLQVSLDRMAEQDS